MIILYINSKLKIILMSFLDYVLSDINHKIKNNKSRIPYYFFRNDSVCEFEPLLKMLENPLQLLEKYNEKYSQSEPSDHLVDIKLVKWVDKFPSLKCQPYHHEHKCKQYNIFIYFINKNALINDTIKNTTYKFINDALEPLIKKAQEVCKPKDKMTEFMELLDKELNKKPTHELNYIFVSNLKDNDELCKTDPKTLLKKYNTTYDRYFEFDSIKVSKELEVSPGETMCMCGHGVHKYEQAELKPDKDKTYTLNFTIMLNKKHVPKNRCL